MTISNKGDQERIERALAESPFFVAAEEWFGGDRPSDLLELVQGIAFSYLEIEQNSPPGETFGGFQRVALPEGDPLALLWTTPTLVLRQAMLQATQLYRTLGILVAHADGEMTVSLHVIGRALLEGVSVVHWLCEPLVSRPGSAEASRQVVRRCLLCSAAGDADLLDESEAYDMDDLAERVAELDRKRGIAVEVFGEAAVHMSPRNPMKWTIEGEGRPGRGELVEETGQRIFSAGVHKSSHYKTQSIASHPSLGSSLGQYVWVDHGERSHHAFVVDVVMVEKWVRYYTLWYQFAAASCAAVHDWPGHALHAHDAEALELFGQSIVLSPDPLTMAGRTL